MPSLICYIYHKKSVFINNIFFLLGIVHVDVENKYEIE